MKKRIVAWNIACIIRIVAAEHNVLQIYWQACLAVYIIVMFGFVLYSSRVKDGRTGEAQGYGQR